MIKQVEAFDMKLSFIDDISEIETKNITLIRPRESFYTWKRRLLVMLNSKNEVYKGRFSVKDFRSYNVSYVRGDGSFKGNINLESLAIIQSSNILPDLSLAKSLGFRKIAVLPVPEELYKKCLVSNNQKLIFVPNFKVMYSTMDKLFSTYENHFIEGKKNSSIIDVQDSKYSDYYKFTIIRNPLDRFLSLYYWSLKHDDYKASVEIITGKEYSLQTLLNVISLIPDTHSNNHWVSQSYKNTLNPVNNLYSIEDTTKISKDLSLHTKKEVLIPHENKSKNSSTKKNGLSKTELEVLSLRYKDDFELFNSL